jgi:hypothetical protein
VIRTAHPRLASASLRPNAERQNHIAIPAASHFFNSLLDVSEATRLKQFDWENTRLKKLLADSMLDNAALRAWLFRGVLH